MYIIIIVSLFVFFCLYYIIIITIFLIFYTYVYVRRKKIYLASKYFNKGYSRDDLRFGDDLYNEENASKLTDEIWEYVEECEDYGRIEFYKKYKDYKLY